MTMLQSAVRRNLFYVIPVMCIGALGAVTALAGDRNDLLFESNFESGEIRPVAENPDGWFVAALSPDHAAITQSAARESDNSIRLFIDKDLDYSSVNGSGADKPRVNLSKYKLKFDYDSDYWIGWSVFIPTIWTDDYETNWTTVMQLKQPIGGSPILSLNIKGDTWEFVNRRDPNNVTYNEGTTDVTVLYRGSTGEDKGRWIDFVVHFRLCETTNCNGVLTIWKNGEEIADRRGRNAYKRSLEDGGPFLTLNLYKSGWKRKASLVDTRELYFDAVRIGGANSDYESVAPDTSFEEDAPVTKPMPPLLGASSGT